MRRLPYLVLLALVVCAVSCSKVPDGVMSTSEMASLMADLYVGESVVESDIYRYNSDSSRRAFKQAIYARHGFTTPEVDSSLYWYGSHLEEYMKVCDETEKILQARIAEAEKRGAKSDQTASGTVSLDGDSVNLWTGPTMRRNSALMPSDYITFAVHRDRNWERGDRYAITAHGIMTRGPVEMGLAVDYNDGTTEFVTLNRSSDQQKQRLVLVLDSMKTASTVYGYIHYAAAPDEVSYLDSLSLTRTRGLNDNKAARAHQQMARYR